MPRRNWKKCRPNNLRDALHACTDYALEKKNHSVERIAELMGVTNAWNLYKWRQHASMPVHLIRPFEQACGCTFVSEYLALSAGKLAIDIPHGTRPDGEVVLAVQKACNEAVTQILRFTDSGTNPDDVVAAIVPALKQLAWHKANAEKASQPELEF